MTTRYGILVIDMLNDFANPEGSLYCEGSAKITGNLQELFKWVRKRRAEGKDDVELIHIQEAHRKNDADFRVRPVHAVDGTWGSDFIQELYPEGEEYIVKKRRHSAFPHTDLDLYLREEKIDVVVVTGVWTNVCVRSTATDALARAYRVVSLEDGIDSKTPEMHEYGMNDLSIFTKVMSIKEFEEAIDAGIDPSMEGAGDPDNKVE